MGARKKTKKEIPTGLGDLRETCAGIEASGEEQRRARNSLERSEILLRKAFHTIPDLIVIIDKDFRIQISNWHGGYDYVPEEARSGNPVCHEAYYGRKTPCETCRVHEVFRTGKPVSWEKLNPNIGHVEIRAYPLFDESGNVTHVMEHVRDMTALKHAEEELQRSKSHAERLLRFSDALLSAIPTPVFHKDREGRYLGCNRAFSEMMGVTSDQIKGRTVMDLWPGEFAEVCHKKDLELINHPAGQVYESMVRDKDGIDRTVIYARDVFRDENGEVAGIVGAFLDISERKEAEEHLKESEKRFKTIFDNNTDGLIVVDNESMKFVLANPTICRMLGFGEEELMGMNVQDVHPDEDLPHVIEQFGKLASGEITIAENVPVKRKDGTIFYADINTSQLTLDGKEYLLGAFRDVTDREQAKDALRDSEGKLKAIVYGSPIPQFVIDHDHRVLYWNNALVQLTGIDAEEMIGTKDQWKAFYAEERPCMADLLLDGDIEKITEMYLGEVHRSNLAANAYESTAFFPGLGKDGKWLYFTGAEIKDARGRTIGVVETLEDITERKLAEESVRRLNEELERKVEKRTNQLLEAREELVRKEKLAVLGQLSGSVGHELRNPLGVMNNAVFFLNTVITDADETVKEYLNIIKQEIDNSNRIITDLLDFSRTTPPQIRTVAVRELINKSLGRCAIPGKIKLRMELPDTLPLLRVDPLQIGQVLQNLFINALQAMPEGGALNVAARPIQGPKFEVQGSEAQNVERRTLNVEHDTDFVEISIEDTGEGIAPANMSKLFQPLFTTKARGIGLGLVVCKNLTEANGGKIGVESEHGVGTKFTLVLPGGRGG